MIVTIFNGTPRKNGNTAELTKCLISELRKEGHTADEVFLNDLDIKGCQNCGKCQKRSDGECSIHDDMTGLYKRFEESDAVIIASPIYMWNFTACAKAFIDRLHALCNEERTFNAMYGKKIAMAMTMGDDLFVAASAVNAMEFFCEYFECRYIGSLAVPYASKHQIARPMYQETIKDFVKLLEQ